MWFIFRKNLTKVYSISLYFHRFYEILFQSLEKEVLSVLNNNSWRKYIF